MLSTTQIYDARKLLAFLSTIALIKVNEISDFRMYFNLVKGRGGNICRKMLDIVKCVLQLNELRHHLSYEGTELTHNLRGVQELNNRKVYMRSSNLFAGDFAMRPSTNLFVLFILIIFMLISL